MIINFQKRDDYQFLEKVVIINFQKRDDYQFLEKEADLDTLLVIICCSLDVLRVQRTLSSITTVSYLPVKKGTPSRGFSNRSS